MIEWFKVSGANRVEVKIEEENRVDEEFASRDEAGKWGGGKE